MSIQANIRAKKIRDARVLSGELIEIDIQSIYGTSVSTIYKEVSEVSLLLLEGFGVQVGEYIHFNKNR